MMRFISVSSTSKHNKEFLQLPDKLILDQISNNFLISTKERFYDFLQEYYNEDIIFLLDTEKKQGIDFYSLAKIKNKIDYKPNDLTMEAADLTILNYFNRDLNGRSIGIYGTGNIAFKLALRLSERNAQVYLYGRNHRKINTCIEALKQITFDASLIKFGNAQSKVDCFVSFVSFDEVIANDFNKILKKESLCLDGGIGNFSKGFIKVALENGHDVRRLDVRQSQEIMDGYINSRLNSQFNEVIGRDTIANHSVVAGGIMGEDGQVIVDRIMKPTTVIGIANGIGGVKHESDLNAEEHIKIHEVQKFIEQNS